MQDAVPTIWTAILRNSYAPHSVRKRGIVRRVLARSSLQMTAGTGRWPGSMPVGRLAKARRNLTRHLLRDSSGHATSAVDGTTPSISTHDFDPSTWRP